MTIGRHPAEDMAVRLNSRYDLTPAERVQMARMLRILVQEVASGDAECKKAYNQGYEEGYSSGFDAGTSVPMDDY
jgi:hypothetical protein